jgi:rSAM/selenodomain-associated transferase 2
MSSDLLMPTAQRRSSTEEWTAPNVSIIVPVFNEAALIRPFLLHLRKYAPSAELVVVDGGSSDGTSALAEGYCDQLLQMEKGRAIQMNAGACAANGDIFWFLHVDVEVPRQCLEEINGILQNPTVAGSYFRIRVPRSALVYRLTDTFAHYAGLVLRIRCGDHGIFCRREIFDVLDGYSDMPLMEDAEFFRMLHHFGSVRAVRSRLQVSPRRYEVIGPFRLTLAYGLIAIFYLLRVPIPVLARFYGRLCSIS